MAAEDICKDYTSSLEDLTFNSKPLINMLTMLAEENSQHAAEIVKLIEKRIYEVSIEQKLPSLYLMDSIVKNIGKDYIAAVAPCIVAIFTHVFEQADEKIRMSMFKLRNTWPTYFSAKILHELDCSVHKRDPGWPVIEPPPPSPSIHINPKFLSKVEESVEDSKSSSSSSDEAKIMEEFERKKKELEQLQGKQMREQMMQLEELKMKYDLIKKKQEKDRQNLLKQQQEQILKMRLQQEEVDSAEETSSDSKLSEASTKVAQSSKDLRLKKVELVTYSKTDTDSSTDNTQDELEIVEVKPSSINSENIVENPVDKVGFNSEFVPLDKDDDNVDITSSVAYNRDRPLGKNRYFKKDPKAKIFKSDTESGSDLGDTKHSKSDGHEDPRSINRRGKRLHGVKHHSDRQNHQSFKEHDRGERETHQERKKNEHGRGRARRRHSGDRPGERSNDRPGETSGDQRLEDRHRIRPGEHPDRPVVRLRDRPGNWDRSGRRPEDHSAGRPRGRLVERPGDRIDVGKDRRRPHRRIGDNEHFEDESLHRHEEWSRGRGQRRLPQSRGVARGETIEGRLRHEFPQPVDNAGRLPERRDREQAFDHPDGVPPYVREEPPFKKSRPSPPRPLFSEREILEIREKRRDSPEHTDHPSEVWRNTRPGFHEPWRHDLGNIRQAPPEFYNNQFPEGPHVGPRPPCFPPPEDVRPFAPRGVHGEFLPPPEHFPGDVEIPLELTLDNESEILRSAEHRRRTGELSAEQHQELLEKLQQLYDLQKWQRRRSVDIPPQHEPGHPFIPQPAIHPHVVGKPVIPEHHLIDDHNRVLVPEGTVQLGEAVMFPHQPPQQAQPGMMFGEEGRPHFSADHILPDQINIAGRDETAVPPSNLVMEKQTVDDLFKRLMDVGIITKVNQVASPARTLTPPIVETQILQEISRPKLPELPEMKLTLEHLRRRYDVVIMKLHCGTQCSSCGLRFKEDNNENYRQHLDWHFRMNRKEKETVAAHRSWFITTDDWLEFESSEDPKVKARSAVFEAESDGESENSEDVQEGSCPVLTDDTETERACDICFEKFETFWDETSEEWHYKNAVRVVGKTYHYICYQDAKETVDSDGDESDEKENTEDNDDTSTIDDNNDTSLEMQNNEEIRVTIENSTTNDKPSIVTEDTALGSGVASGVGSVVQGGDDVAVDKTNKEEIKTESS